MRDRYDLIIVGGGAAGLFAAAYISDKAPELSVLVLEGNDRVGKKLLTTGNGRCQHFKRLRFGREISRRC